MKTEYLADETGSVITNIPYKEYIRPCNTPDEYIIPEIAESKSGEENSLAINHAVDILQPDGGCIYIPKGKYKVSTIVLKSNTTLFISKDAALISLDCEENCISATPLHGGVITAENAENIAITGGGTIIGLGKTYTDEPETKSPLYALKNFNTYQRVIEARKRIRFGKQGIARYSLIHLTNCFHTDINNIVLKESAGWTLVINGGADHRLHNLVIDNHIHVANTDGIDLLNCKSVTVHKCFIATADDGIVLKPRNSDIADIQVSDCEICSCANCFKIGTETACDVTAVSVKKCRFFMPDNMTYGYSGIAIESADGSNISDVKIDDIKMNGISSPILIWLGKRLRYGNANIGSIQNIVISNVVANNTELPSAITGCTADGKCYSPQNIKLQNTMATYRNTGESLNVKLPVLEWSMSDYPDIVRINHRYIENHIHSDYFDLPCYGIFIRYADADYRGYQCTPRACSTLPFEYVISES